MIIYKPWSNSRYILASKTLVGVLYGEHHRAMSNDFFIPEIKQGDLLVGPTCHAANEAVNLLQETFAEHNISRRLHPSSCQLTPLDWTLEQNF